MSAEPAQSVEELSAALEAVQRELANLRAEFEEFLEAREDEEAVAAFDRIMASPPEETFPGEMVARLVNGGSPVAVFREHRGMTQAQLAKAAGTTPSYVSQIETGHRDAGKTLRKRLAEALSVDEEDLL